MLSASITASYRPCGELRLKAQLFSSDERGQSLKAQDAPPLSKASKSQITSDNSAMLPGWGAQPAQTIFTVHAKRFVEDAAAVIEQEYGKQVVMVTVTLPGSTREANEALCNWSAYITSRLTQWFRNTAPGCDFVYVWERQKRGALHMHVALAHSNILKLRAVQKGIKEYWCGLLSSVSSKAGVDLFARRSGGTWRYDWEQVRANAEPVRKSITAYLAKYLSKNKIARSQLRQSDTTVPLYFPTRWWGVTNKIRDKVLARRTFQASAIVALGAVRSTMDGVKNYLAQSGLFMVEFANKWKWGETTLVVRGAPSVVSRIFEHVSSLEVFNSFSKKVERMLQKKQPAAIELAVREWCNELDSRYLSSA